MRVGLESSEETTRKLLKTHQHQQVVRILRHLIHDPFQLATQFTVGIGRLELINRQQQATQAGVAARTDDLGRQVDPFPLEIPHAHRLLVELAVALIV